jgi:hypothetical protein
MIMIVVKAPASVKAAFVADCRSSFYGHIAKACEEQYETGWRARALFLDFAAFDRSLLHALIRGRIAYAYRPFLAVGLVIARIVLRRAGAQLIGARIHLRAFALRVLRSHYRVGCADAGGPSALVSAGAWLVDFAIPVETAWCARLRISVWCAAGENAWCENQKNRENHDRIPDCHAVDKTWNIKCLRPGKSTLP